MENARKRLKEEIEAVNREIEELEDTLESTKKYKERLQFVLSSEIDLDSKVSDFKDFPNIPGKLNLIKKAYSGYYYKGEEKEITVYDLIYFSDYELLRIKGFGKKTLSKIKNWIEQKGLIQL